MTDIDERVEEILAIIHDIHYEIDRLKDKIKTVSDTKIIADLKQTISDYYQDIEDFKADLKTISPNAYDDIYGMQ